MYVCTSKATACHKQQLAAKKMTILYCTTILYYNTQLLAAMIPATVKATATATATATPGDANWGFRRVLSALWKKRKAAHEAVHLVARAARGGLAPLCGRVAATKSGHCVRIYVLGVQTGVLVSPRKTSFFNILTTFWSPWQFPGDHPWRRQFDVPVRFELPSEPTKSCPIRLLPWARRQD